MEEMPVSDATFTFRVDEGLKAEFANAAKARDRTGAQLLRDFMRSYVAQQEDAQQYDVWLAKKVDQSRASAETGNLIPASDVEARFAARRAATRARMPAPE
jgi:predicted transcriptional regulator